MRNEATGALIAVIGDDNDDFLLIGTRRDFIAERDGVLCLGVNEGNTNDTTGTFDVVIEAEAGARYLRLKPRDSWPEAFTGRSQLLSANAGLPIGLRPLFFFNDTATTEIYTLSLHDALPI